MRNEKGQFVKGFSSSPETSFKKGHTPWTKGRTDIVGHWKGKKFSEEHRKNMSIAFTGRKGPWAGKKRDPEMYKRIVAKRRAGVGYVVSDKTRHIISETQKGNKSGWKCGQHISKKG